MYQSEVERLRREVADLERRIASERTRAAGARDDAYRVRRSIGTHTSPSTLRMKLSQIDRYEAQAIDRDKAAARLMMQAANKSRSLAVAQTRLERALQQEARRSIASGGRPAVPLDDESQTTTGISAKSLPELTPGFRIVMFTDIQDSTRQAHREGDAAALATVNVHDTLVRGVIAYREGTEIKHTGDGLMVSFDGLLNALHAAVEIQRAVDVHNQAAPSRALHVRIGLAAGEPLVRARDLIGATVQLAARLTDIAPRDGILVPASLMDLARGSGLVFEEADSATPQGIDDPIQTFVLKWRTEDYEITQTE
jgi:class 3 adenylate cyclase